MTKVHCVIVIVLDVVDYAHDSLIVSEEKDSETCYDVDSRDQIALFEIMNDIQAPNAQNTGIGFLSPLCLIGISV